MRITKIDGEIIETRRGRPLMFTTKPRSKGGHRRFLVYYPAKMGKALPSAKEIAMRDINRIEVSPRTKGGQHAQKLKT